jgi:hypothetical protein
MGKSNSFGGTEPQRRRHVVINEAGKAGLAVLVLANQRGGAAFDPPYAGNDRQ